MEIFANIPYLGYILKSYNILRLPFEGIIFISNIKSTVDTIDKIVSYTKFVNKIYSLGFKEQSFLEDINSGWSIL